MIRAWKKTTRKIRRAIGSEAIEASQWLLAELSMLTFRFATCTAFAYAWVVYIPDRNAQRHVKLVALALIFYLLITLARCFTSFDLRVLNDEVQKLRREISELK